MTYPTQAQELLDILCDDQAEARVAGAAYFNGSKEVHNVERAALKQHIRKRTRRMLEILDEIGEPSIVNVGPEAAQAVSILATHAGGDVLKRVVAAFNTIYDQDKNNCYYQAIPAMTDWVLIREHKAQRFGTQWLFDDRKQPFLPTVEDFGHVNERRSVYDIEPLRWPKSLAIPESEQPWLKHPLSELIMRDPTEVEYKELEESRSP